MRLKSVSEDTMISLFFLAAAAIHRSFSVKPSFTSCFVNFCQTLFQIIPLPCTSVFQKVVCRGFTFFDTWFFCVVLIFVLSLTHSHVCVRVHVNAHLLFQWLKENYIFIVYYSIITKKIQPRFFSCIG